MGDMKKEDKTSLLKKKPREEKNKTRVLMQLYQKNFLKNRLPPTKVGGLISDFSDSEIFRLLKCHTH